MHFNIDVIVQPVTHDIQPRCHIPQPSYLYIIKKLLSIQVSNTNDFWWFYYHYKIDYNLNIGYLHAIFSSSLFFKSHVIIGELLLFWWMRMDLFIDGFSWSSLLNQFCGHCIWRHRLGSYSSQSWSHIKVAIMEPDDV